MKAVLISIQPKWVELIANGKKTIEVRKTHPNIKTPFKCYIYMSQGAFKDLKSYSDWIYQNRMRVIGEFVCDDIIKIGNYQEVDYSYMLWVKDRETTDKLCKEACLDEFAIQDYLGEKGGYGWHISNLKIYDKPKELSEFATICEGLKPYQCDKCEYSYTENSESGSYAECCCNNLKPLKRPPQSWCYVEELNNERI